MRLPGACAVLAALSLIACAAPARKTAPSPAAAAGSSAQLAAAIDSASRDSEHEADARIRSNLADAAQRDADACIQQEPNAVACLFGRAVALGLQAKAHPTRALALLTDMLETLTRAEAADPAYKNAGPARVQALVLARAPGWPLGPGDPERALAAAQRAASLQPAYPPNILALAEVQAKTDSAAEARASYARAREIAQHLPDSADRSDWLQQAESGLSHTK